MLFVHSYAVVGGGSAGGPCIHTRRCGFGKGYVLIAGRFIIAVYEIYFVVHKGLKYLLLVWKLLTWILLKSNLAAVQWC